MRTNRLNPVGLVVVVLGATVGSVLALVLVRRWRRGREAGEAGFGEIPWRELITLVGPIVALTRRLVEMTRRELIELEG